VYAHALANPTIESITIGLKAATAKRYPNAGLVLMLPILRANFAFSLRIVEQFEPLSVKLQDPFDFERLFIEGSELRQDVIHGAVGRHAV
jgi:hypothetical protein